MAPNSSQLLDPRANHGHATGPNRPRPIGIAWPRPLDSGRSIYPIDSNHPIRIKMPDLDQSKVPSPCRRLRIRLLNLTPGLTVRSALPTHSFGSLTEHGPSARLFHPESFGLATRLGPNRPAWLSRTVCLVEPNRPACTKTRLKSFNSGLLNLGNPCRIFVKLARHHFRAAFLDGLRYGAWLWTRFSRLAYRAAVNRRNRNHATHRIA